MQMPGSQPSFGMSYTGDGTYYGATGAGACSYDASPANLMVAAMNAPQWQNSAVCGMCVEVTGPKGDAAKIVVRIVDLCPECKTGDLDLSQEAFAKIADPVAGRVKITWQPVACAVSGPISYKYKDGTSQWWMGVQVRNSRLPVKKLELVEGAVTTELKAESYGYYTLSSSSIQGGRPGPYSLRLTSITDAQLSEPSVPLSPNVIVQGTQQFP
jgi:expansin (peptidoglycan-binding protein)